MTNQKITGIALLLIVIIPIGVWGILLNVSIPLYETWENNFRNLLSEKNGMRQSFYASILSATFSFIAAITYFSKLSKSKSILLLLLLFCLLQAIIAIALLNWDLKIIYSIPVVFGYLAYKSPNK